MAFALVPLAARAQEPRPPARAADLVKAGSELLAAQCARCHATGRDDASPLAAAPPFRSLSGKYPIGHLAEALAEGITTGHPDMPEFVFSIDEIDAILAYIESISERPGPR